MRNINGVDFPGDGSVVAINVPTTREIVISIRQDKDLGDYSTLRIKDGADGQVSGFVPEDFESLVEMALRLIPTGSDATADIDLTSSYAAPGEPQDTNSESDLVSTYNLVADEIFDLDLSGVFTALAAGDSFGLTFGNQAADDIHLLAIRLNYVLKKPLPS